MKLVSDWKDCWRWFSMHALIASVALQAAWMAVPDDLRSIVSPRTAHIIAIVLLVLGFAGRLIDQQPRDMGAGGKVN